MIPVQDVGIEVHSVRPRYRAGDVVKPDFRKAFDSFERLEHATFEDPFEVELPDESIGECEAQTVSAEVFDIDDPWKAAHGIRLPKRLDRFERFRPLRPFPVRQQFRSP